MYAFPRGKIDNNNKLALLANYGGITFAILKSIIGDFLALLKSIMLNFWSIIASCLAVYADLLKKFIANLSVIYIGIERGSV